MPKSASKIRRNIKDSVFKSLFSIKENQIKLLEEFFPEKKPIDGSKIKRVTLESTFANGLINDLAIQYGDEIVFMAEEQSEWDDVLPLRFSLYAQKEIIRYVEQNKIHLHDVNISNILLPKITLALIYLGKGHPESKIEVSKVCPQAYSNFIIHVYHHGPVIGGIMDQYINFGKTHLACIKKYKGNPEKAIYETISICEANHWLTSFIQEHQGEIKEMTMQINSAAEIDKQIRQHEYKNGLNESLLASIRSTYAYLCKTKSKEESKKQTIEMLNTNEDMFDKAMKSK